MPWMVREAFDFTEIASGEVDDPVDAAHVDAVLDHVEDLSLYVMKSTQGVDKNSPEFLEKRQECAATGTQGLANSRLWDCVRVCVFSLLHKISKTQIRNPNTRHQSGALAQGLEKLEKFLNKFGMEGYAVGTKITIADIHVLALLTFMGSGFWDGIPADFSNSFARITIVRR